MLRARLSGIATTTHHYVKATGTTGVRVADTRKTSPGVRFLERYAVRVGGGFNHRADLAAGILIKDNHVAVCGSVREAVRRARKNGPHGLRVEVEITSLDQLAEAVEEGAEIILLDNFQVPQMAEAVRRLKDTKPRPLLEVSGGVTLERLPEICQTGVDLVSVGALTHSARAVDLSLEMTLAP